MTARNPMKGVHMGRKRFVAAFVATLGAAVALAAAGTAGATSGTPVTISGQTTFGSPGTFTTSPGAGLCASGTTTDVTSATGFQSGNHVLFHDIKTFTCDDGSGTFTLNLQVMLRFDNSTDSFTWSVVSGTGAYANLHGTGSGVGLEGDNEVSDFYTGSVHFN
jgi:hypothetical protein